MIWMIPNVPCEIFCKQFFGSVGLGIAVHDIALLLIVWFLVGILYITYILNTQYNGILSFFGERVSFENRHIHHGNFFCIHNIKLASIIEWENHLHNMLSLIPTVTQNKGLAIPVHDIALILIVLFLVGNLYIPFIS